MSIKKLAVKIMSESDSVKNNASELREAISVLEPKNQDELFELIDGIIEYAEDINTQADDIESDAISQEDKIGELEDEITALEDKANEEPNMTTMSGHITYKTDNMIDEGIMEVFYECISKIQPATLLSLLQGNLSHSLENKIKEHKVGNTLSEAA